MVGGLAGRLRTWDNSTLAPKPFLRPKIDQGSSARSWRRTGQLSIDTLLTYCNTFGDVLTRTTVRAAVGVCGYPTVDGAAGEGPCPLRSLGTILAATLSPGSGGMTSQSPVLEVQNWYQSMPAMQQYWVANRLSFAFRKSQDIRILEHKWT